MRKAENVTGDRSNYREAVGWGDSWGQEVWMESVTSADMSPAHRTPSCPPWTARPSTNDQSLLNSLVPA